MPPTLRARRLQRKVEPLALGPHVAPSHERQPPLLPLSTIEMDYAIAASVCGSLDGVAWAMNVTRGQAKQSLGRVAKKIPGTLPALMRVIVWVRGGSAGVLGVQGVGRIPEHLLRPEWRGDTAPAPDLSPGAP